MTELGGGVGLTAWYATRFGLTNYAVVDQTVLQAVQAFALGELPADPVTLIAETALADRSETDVLILEDGFFERPATEAITALKTVCASGVGKILAISQEAKVAGLADRPTMAGLIDEVKGYRLIGRQRHALRPGYVEEV